MYLEWRHGCHCQLRVSVLEIATGCGTLFSLKYYPQVHGAKCDHKISSNQLGELSDGRPYPNVRYSIYLKVYFKKSSNSSFGKSTAEIYSIFSFG